MMLYINWFLRLHIDIVNPKVYNWILVKCGLGRNLEYKFSCDAITLISLNKGNAEVTSTNS